jgi:hypothetical protein
MFNTYFYDNLKVCLYIYSLPKNHGLVVTIKIGDIQNITSLENDQDYSGIDCNIIRIHQLAELEHVSNLINQNCNCMPLKPFPNIHKLYFLYRNCHVLLLELRKKKLVYQGMDGWTFEGCAWCGRGVFVSEGYLKCSNDHKNPRVTLRLLVVNLYIFFEILIMLFCSLNI